MAGVSKKSASKKKAAKKTATKKASGKQAGSPVPVKTATTGSGLQGAALVRLEDLEKVFDDLFQRRWPRPFRWGRPGWGDLSNMFEEKVPSIDVIDRSNEVLVRAEVPGIEKDDLDVSIADRTLTIKGSSRKEEKEQKDDYFRHEIRSGTFSRSVLLPADVNAGEAKASFKDGVVELHLPKLRASKRQKISVS
jgi:HSP20 family protein